MYSEDGTQRVVYKLKEEHAREGWEKKEKERKQRQKKKSEKRKRTVSITKRKQSLCQLWAFNIREDESFYYTKVNLVLYTYALQIILFGPIYVRTQYHFGSLQIESLQYLTQAHY